MTSTYDNDTAEKVVFALQPLKGIHLNSNYLFETEAGGNGNAVSFLFFIDIFVLLIAWFNYINLSTARSEMRAKEVGIRKVAGSDKRSLIFQFLTEAALLNLLAILCSFALAQLLSPWFIKLVDKPIPMSIFTNGPLLLAILATFLIGTVLAGLYPAFLLSSFKPISVLKTDFTSNQVSRENWMRKGLVVFQFMASIGLIASTLVVYNQLQFMQKSDLGIDIDKTLIIKSPILRDSTYGSTSLTFKKELESLAAVKEISATTSVPGQEFGWTAGINLVGAPEGEWEGLHALAVDHNYAESYGMKFMAGRPMDKNNSNDVNSVILNERGAKQFKFNTSEEALGAQINFWGDVVTVIGVVKNFHQESPKSVIEPMIMRVLTRPEQTRYYSLKMNTQDLQSSITRMEAKWNEFFPGNSFDYFFLDNHFNQQYASNRLFGKIFTLFSGLAFFVSCLGLFALVAFVAERKRKEIGIRKVLGASVPSIVGLLSKEFIKLVIVALVIATPLAWFSMNSWLDNFENRIDIPLWIFGVSGILAMVIAFVTVSFHGSSSLLVKIGNLLMKNDFQFY
ncbi:MAG: putative ABC transport system permease protein [Paraglaciecola sp.]|jgi:putative ABC transport system permease protein